MVDLGSIHTYEKDQPFFTKGWSSREIGMLASITVLGHNTQALEFNTKPVIGVTAGPNLGKKASVKSFKLTDATSLGYLTKCILLAHPD